MSTFMFRALAASAVAAAVLTGVCFWSRLPASEAGGPDQPLRQIMSPGDTLTDDGRIGKVTDVQGIVAIQPGMAQRWSPLAGCMPVRPGDWLRTDPRGANAVSLQLVGQARLVLGPGTLVEVVSSRQVRIAEGELRVVASARQPVELVGPDGGKTVARARQFYRVEKRSLVGVAKEPPWLASYEGKTAHESIGSLVAKVDGRDVPLTVGYHKVAVDIRDQIARTTVEESFVNQTKATLEGVFYFPLPQDASIAGFGMWIGDRLVEADVVEKQRAREIYETILREHRDPGLLEWSGGNIFKARVFPILPQSEKRITITYTEVLPLRGNAYRYQYGLQSELLRQHPLRQLEIDVKISSAVPLRRVASPTHPTRNSLTAHAAHAEFSALEYTPAEDFEVLAELDGRQPELVLIPHRRGDDGYFMLQLTPPGAPASQEGWQRQTLGDGPPLELLIVADTSASMDAASRNLQAEFVAAILGSLGPKDKFNLAACDVDCPWVFARPMAAEAGNIERARQFLAARVSLGWSDLDRAMASAMKQCGPATQVVYIGDGIVTTGDGDPAAFARRLRRLAEGKPGTFHAVVAGNSFEPGVLKAIASIGGGSMRQIGGSRSPRVVALELLREISQPVLRDARIKFRGIRAARVYPETLPNLPQGTQQIILGRYLPEPGDQAGEVIVTGALAGKPVRYAAQVLLKGAGAGNSYIPRLWARMHLDALLQQGTAAPIRDEIIALSEEYHIITPYTSLLVLDNDADRQRFQVKPHFRLRDGEKFFAQGRDTANWDLIQQQMKRAGTWRLGLRREVLRELGTLGRDPKAFVFPSGSSPWSYQPGTDQSAVVGYASLGLSGARDYSGWGRVNINTLAYEEDAIENRFLQDAILAAGLPEDNSNFSFFVGFLDGHGSRRGRSALADLDILTDSLAAEEEKLLDETHEIPVNEIGTGANDDLRLSAASISAGSWDTPVSSMDLPDEDVSGDGEASADWAIMKEAHALQEKTKILVQEADEPIGVPPEEDEASNRADMNMGATTALGLLPFAAAQTGGLSAYGRPPDFIGMPLLADRSSEMSMCRLARSEPWFDALFPVLPPPPVEPKERKSRWPAEARQLARSLLRRDALTGVKDGLRIETRWQGFDPRHQEPTGGADALALVWPVGWLLRSAGDDSPTTLAWCDGHQRAVVNGAFLLGRARTATPADLLRPPVDLGPGAELPLDLVYRNFSVQVTPQSGGRKMLVLTAPFNAKYEIRMLIDAARSVVLRVESVVDGKVDAATTLDDFVQVVGAWYAGRIETTDSRGRRTSLVTRKITALGPGERDRQWNAEMAALAIPQQVQLLRQPLGKLSDARKAEAAGKATFEDEISLLLDFAASQQWDRVFTHLDRAEKLSGKPGMKWVRSALLDLGRRREELRVRIMAEAGRLAKEAASVRPLPPGDLMCLSQHMLDQSSNIFQANETLALLDVLRPIYARQPDGRRAMKKWTSQRIDGLQRAGRATDALKLREEQVRQWPHDADLQETCARTLAETGEYDAALAWLDRAMADENRWDADQRDALASLRAELLHSAGRYDEMADFLARWLPRNPQGTKLYEQYLSSLFWADRTDALDALIQWLKEGRRPGPLPPEVDARLGAAVELALGHVFYLNTNHVEPRWLAALGETAIYSARQDSPSSAGDRIMYDLEFRNTVEYHRVCKVVAQMLRDEMERLSPERFLRLVGWISSDESAVEPQLWQKIAGRLRRCWETEPKPEIKHQLGQSLSTILSDHVSKSEWLAFLRAQLADAPDDYRPIYALQLFGALLSQPWSDAYEREAFSLVRQLTDAEDPIARLTAEIAAVHRLTDRFAQARFDARAKAIDHPEKLTRTQLREGRAKALRLAREGLADRLREAARTAPPELARWVDIEATYLDVISGRDLDRAGQQCWKLLGDAPRPETSPLDAILQRRSLATLLNLAARKNAPPGLADRVMKWLEGAARSEPDQPRWKQSQYQLLVALDRPKDLEKRLRQWIDAGDPGSPWRLTLGYLLAEQGRLAEAIGLLEAVLAGAALRGAELRLLADWYSATNRREDHDRAMIDAFKTVEEGRLDNWLSRKLWPWQRRDRSTPPPPPRELDPQVPPAFAALLEKSPRPGNYLRQLRDAYQATGDFRLLAGLADSMVGHTAGQVYSFLQGMSDVLSPIGDEATVDSIADQIAKVRGRAKTATDQRALDLLEMFVQRRAAELKNQPGPHAARALASLRRAWKREWSPGERPLLAGLLASLGRMPDPQLAEEQVRQLESLHREAVAGSSDRLQIAHELARVLWSYSRRDAAIDLLTAALDEYQAASGGVLPSDAFGGPYGRGVGHSYGYGSSYGYGVANASADESAGEPFSTLLGYLEEQGHFARAETILQEQLKRPVNRRYVHWLTERLYGLYQEAIAHDGQVSLGQGVALYHAVEQKIQGELGAYDRDYRRALVGRLCGIYRTARDKKIAGVAGDLKRLAFQRLPEVFKRPIDNDNTTVFEVADTLYRVAGPRDGLAFLVQRIESEPRWLAQSYQGGWDSFGNALADWRTQVKDLGDLEPRLLKVVLKELRRHLQTNNVRDSSIYQSESTCYWREKEDAFVKTAQDVAAENKDSNTIIGHVAEYLYWRVKRPRLAIEILLDARRRGVLEDGDQSRLAEFLQAQDRFAESVEILEPLLQRRPEGLSYRVLLMHGYFKTNRPRQLAELLAKTDALFHRENHWNEEAMSTLGHSCLENQLYQQSVAYFEEAISHLQRTRAHRGIGDGTLSGYYGGLARAYAGLKKTIEAVDAAAGEMVARGQRVVDPFQGSSQDAAESLKMVIRQSPDLDAYVAQLDRRTQESGLDNPIVRKAVGQVYLEKRDYAKAIRQLNLAAQSQPNDGQTYQALLDCYDRMGDKRGAIEQLLRWRDLARRDLKLYEDLGNRYQAMGEPGQAERAYTSLVEVLPAEAESHRRLAEIRQRQNRWDDAIAQWQEVARLGATEPTGLLGLAQALIHEHRVEQAAETLAKLKQTSWPPRFADVPNRIRLMEQECKRNK